MSNLIRRHERRDAYPSLFRHLFENDRFNGFFEGDLPAVNVKETKKEFKLEISAPGFEKGDISLSVDNNVITISAKKEERSEEKGEDETVLRQEFSSASFFRQFTLPDGVDTEKIEATEKNGVLKITLPKMEKALEDKKRQIEIH